ncbi:MAG TPA: HD-GYP domain-containing protein, partial [Acidimicrobiales bacterium]|nr:HD-GYP domain-containing protein [Acidimicrobiales bacterium]
MERSEEPSQAAGGARWQSRELLGRFLVAIAYLVPIGAAVTVSAVVSRHMSAPQGLGSHVEDFAVLIGIATVVVVIVDRLSRRLLPLAALLKLSLVFPDRAPRRLAIARRAGSIRNLRERIEYAKQHGLSDEPSEAAANILELVGALHAHDPRTRGHAERVRVYTDLLATELRLSREDQDRLRWSALLHDIGKLHVSARVLNKPGRLTAREWEAIHRHPEDGAKLAAPLVSFLGSWADTIVQHHERWDGTGYPLGLSGHDIGFGGRIVAVADSYEVMTAPRAYKKGMSVAAARRELTLQAGKQFDPAVVRAFLAISIGRLRWTASPLSWVAQLPFVGWIPHVAEGAAASAGSAVGVLGTAAGMTL